MQVPKLIRGQFKIEPEQVLKVGLDFLDLGKGWQFFYAKIAKDGRILVPLSTLSLLQGEKPSLAGYLMEITIEPA